MRACWLSNPGTSVPTGACFTWVTIFESLSLSFIWTLKITMSDCRQIAEHSPCYAFSFCLLFILLLPFVGGFPGGSDSKEFACNQETWFEPWVSPREGNGKPLQYYCLENPRDRGAWWAAVYGLAQSRTRLKRLSCSSSRDHLTYSRDVHKLYVNTVSFYIWDLSIVIPHTEVLELYTTL